jgi:hypothetical protein
VSSSSSPSPSASCTRVGSNLAESVSSSSAGVAVPSRSPASGVVSELLGTRGVPKLNGDVLEDDPSSVLAPEAFMGMPKPNPTGLPMLPLAFPKAPNGFCLVVELEPNVLPNRPSGAVLSAVPNALVPVKLVLGFVSFALSSFAVAFVDPNPRKGGFGAALGPKNEGVDELVLERPTGVLVIFMFVSESGDDLPARFAGAGFCAGAEKLKAA